MNHAKKAFGIAMALFLLPSCASIHLSDSNYGYGTFWYYHLFEGGQSDLESMKQKVVSTSFICDDEATDAPNGIAAINSKKNAKPSQILRNELEFVEEMRSKTDGYFSPYAGGLTSLWLTSLEKGEIPSEEDIRKEVNKISETFLVFDGEEVIKVGDGLLDLGGVGKGWCLDSIKEDLDEKGLTKYWISGGGSSILFGENPNGKDGFTKVEPEDLPNRYFYCKNEAIATSSCSKQLYVVDGKRYSHIVNPFTGSAEVDLDAVIVKGESAAVCDVLSTAIYLQGIESIAKYEREFSVKVIAIKDKETVYVSNGFEILE